jgi:hypothetical protein
MTQASEQRGALGTFAMTTLLDRLGRSGELSAFTVLLGEMRQAPLGKDWQPDDTLLKEFIRGGRKDLIDVMLASWLNPARLGTTAMRGMPLWRNGLQHAQPSKPPALDRAAQLPCPKGRCHRKGGKAHGRTVNVPPSRHLEDDRAACYCTASGPP